MGCFLRVVDEMILWQHSAENQSILRGNNGLLITGWHLRVRSSWVVVFFFAGC